MGISVNNDYPFDADLGTNMAFCVTVTNHGTNLATGVVAVTSLPEELNLISMLPSQGTAANSAGTVTWNLGSLAGGQSATLTLTVSYLEVPPEIVAVVAAVSADQTDLHTASNKSEDALAFGEKGP